MPKKIVIDFKKNEVITYGRIRDSDVQLAIARLRLRLRQTRPSFRDKAKKAVKCAWKAFVMTVSGASEFPMHIIVKRPLLLECRKK